MGEKVVGIDGLAPLQVCPMNRRAEGSRLGPKSDSGPACPQEMPTICQHRLQRLHVPGTVGSLVAG